MTEEIAGCGRGGGVVRRDHGREGRLSCLLLNGLRGAAWWLVG